MIISTMLAIKMGLFTEDAIKAMQKASHTPKAEAIFKDLSKIYLEESPQNNSLEVVKILKKYGLNEDGSEMPILQAEIRKHIDEVIQEIQNKDFQVLGCLEIDPVEYDAMEEVFEDEDEDVQINDLFWHGEDLVREWLELTEEEVENDD